MVDLHDIVSDVKRVVSKLGRIPTRDEYLQHGFFSRRQFDAHGGWNELLAAAGLRQSKRLTKPKTLILDIETAPMLAFVWRIRDENIGLNQLIKNSHLMSWAAKWEGSSEVYYHDQRGEKDIEDDSRIAKSMWRLLNQADFVVGHNVDKFDLKVLNTRMLLADLPPPLPYKTADTLKIARAKFSFPSYKLEYIAKIIGVGEKMTKRQFAGFELWKETLKGNDAAWDEMKAYNIQDTVITEEVFKKIRRWKNPINVNLYHDEDLTVCICGSDKWVSEGKFTYTATNRFEVFRCAKCGEVRKGRDGLFSKEKRKTI